MLRIGVTMILESWLGNPWFNKFVKPLLEDPSHLAKFHEIRTCLLRYLCFYFVEDDDPAIAKNNGDRGDNCKNNAVYFLAAGNRLMIY